VIARNLFLDELASVRGPDDVVVFTMSPCNYWPQASPSPLNLFVGGAMGYASSVALGLALAAPERRVIVLDGDGSLLMNLGTLVTLGHARPSNLVHFVLENGLYELTGRVGIPGRGAVDFEAIARGAGLEATTYDELEPLAGDLPSLLAPDRPRLVCVRVEPGAREPMQATDTLRRAPELAHEMTTLLAGARA